MYKRFKVIIILALVATLLIGCGQSNSKDNEEKEIVNNAVDNRPLLLNSEMDSVLVYFASENGRYLVPTTLPIKPTKEAAKVSVEKVLAGPGDWLLSNTIPEDTKLRDIYIRENVAYIDLTDDFVNLGNYEDVERAINSLVLTLTEFYEVQTVQFLIEGRIHEAIDGFSLDKPFMRPAFINSLNPPSEDQKIIDVYFSDPNALYLIPMGFGVDENSSVNQMVEIAMKELVSGPPLNTDLVKTIWSGTKVNSVSYEADRKLAIINLSEEVMGYGGGTSAEVFLVKSILFTLTAIDEVNEVQILIDGERVDYLPEGMEISKPLSRPEHINYINP
ncbi:MAG: hypothetical protein APF76_18320 [Desulfitibacter sp. BRH_c19]|nr:MAG: hypothetical protein APF76_18320 [Desulfitibacter sp. BRH_c19]